jgi:hypothetical protein
MRADTDIPGGLLFIWGVFPSFRFHVLAAAVQKPSMSALQKWKKHFLWDKTKIGLIGIPRHPKGHVHVQYGLVPTKLCMIMAESSSFHIKVMQPRTW